MTTTLAELLDQPIGSPDPVADPLGPVSWDELRGRVDPLVTALRSVGVHPGDRVGVMLETSAQAFVAVHGVLRAGGVVVPLDPRAPTAAVAAAVIDAGAQVIITDASPRRLGPLVASVDLRTLIGPDDDLTAVPSLSWTDVATHEPSTRSIVDPADPAYLIYTSGSTGRPKGILHTHRSGLAYARLAADAYGLGRDDRVATLSPLHFDQSTFSLYAAPLAGSQAVMVPDEIVRFPADLTSVIQDLAVTVWYSVPTLLMQVLERGVLQSRDLSALRWVLFGGELFPPEILADLMGHLPGTRFSNVYGPAEVNQCTFHHLDAAPRTDAPIPIGQAWDETDVRVVDPAGQTVVPGETGEILVRSSTAMDGYWADPEATDAAFRSIEPDPTTGRWYATGDVGWWNADGDLVFAGRMDNQVKVRGHRIELESIDVALRSAPDVTGAVAVLRSNADGTNEIIALVTAPDTLDHRDVRRHLAGLVPPYALPSEIIVVSDLPKTSTGKIDRPAATSLALTATESPVGA